MANIRSTVSLSLSSPHRCQKSFTGSRRESFRSRTETAGQQVTAVIRGKVSKRGTNWRSMFDSERLRTLMVQWDPARRSLPKLKPVCLCVVQVGSLQSDEWRADSGHAVQRVQSSGSSRLLLSVRTSPVTLLHVPPAPLAIRKSWLLFTYFYLFWTVGRTEQHYFYRHFMD